ncbi:uncharacterized protein LOC118343667 [Juglans regia]|uniref:Uncharacterized protein LOC118343667 n=2 Tax=Juglans regia TaxID=51240 RepID=A0A6P9DZU6_JUGRE|nr:uncharacterized protein LOC118343667 [Juglans regia]
MRQQGQYTHSGVNTYASSQMHQMSTQRMEQKLGPFEGRLEAFTPEREHPYGTSNAEGRWKWERDGSKVSNSVASYMSNEGQGSDAPRSYFHGQRPDPKLALEKQSNSDTRSQTHEENMDLGFEDNALLQTFEGLEQKFHDDIMKLAKEQNEIEDAENARHRERINTINAQYEEQLVALRARHASRREEFLQRESQARHHQYQKAMMDQYPNSSMGSSDPHGYIGIASSGAVGEARRGYNSDHFDSYGERARFLGGARDEGLESRGPYPGGRVYDTGSRYY